MLSSPADDVPASLIARSGIKDAPQMRLERKKQLPSLSMRSNVQHKHQYSGQKEKTAAFGDSLQMPNVSEAVKYGTVTDEPMMQI